MIYNNNLSFGWFIKNVYLWILVLDLSLVDLR